MLFLPRCTSDNEPSGRVAYPAVACASAVLVMMHAWCWRSRGWQHVSGRAAAPCGCLARVLKWTHSHVRPLTRAAPPPPCSLDQRLPIPVANTPSPHLLSSCVANETAFETWLVQEELRWGCSPGPAAAGGPLRRLSCCAWAVLGRAGVCRAETHDAQHVPRSMALLHAAWLLIMASTPLSTASVTRQSTCATHSTPLHQVQLYVMLIPAHDPIALLPP